MARVIIDGFETVEQAKEFYSWFEGQGEQDASIWFEAINDKSPYTDMDKPMVVEGDTVTFTVKMEE